MWYSPSHGLIKSPRAITKDGVNHPSQIFRAWSKSELANIGIYELRMSTPDSRYYNTGAEVIQKQESRDADGQFNNGVDWYELSYSSTEKNVDDLKTQMIQSIKTHVAALLSPSDWRIIREQEGYKVAGEEWKTWRGAVRDHGNALELEIEAITDLDGVKAFQNHPIVEVRYVSTYGEDGTETITTDTESHNREVDKAVFGFPDSPDVEVDPYHVRYE
nr:N-acetylmuramidase/lysin [uncultured Gammaproteobacteria bacterium]